MQNFSLLIVDWYRQNKRALPWRSTKDPYKIWLSEIILQQTRVEQGTAYYHKFTAHYPTVIDLANASEQAVLNDWQGLGYYSRARNLHHSAKIIATTYGGTFPDTYNEILALKGVGKYTAAAIASFAFNEPKAVVDGNVYRFLSRVFNIYTPIDSNKGQKEFQMVADELISELHPGDHNQAMMELGAVICTPTQPKCMECPVNMFCEARLKDTIDQLPVKSKKTKVRDRYFHYLIYTEKEHTLIEQRTAKDIWQHLYQFPLLETTSNELPDLNISTLRYSSEQIIHKLSHQNIHAVFHVLNGLPKKLDPGQKRIKISDIQDYPLPRIIDRYLEKNTL